MKKIYLDNAATSFPKAPGVGDAVRHFIDQIGGNVNRSGYDALTSDEMVFETREMLAHFFNFPTPENVIFTLNITYSLNFLLKGLLEPGDHVIVSSMEHNAVMRPLMQLQEQGVDFSRLVCDELGRLDANSLHTLVRPNTKMVVLTHASNVSGTILPVEEIGSICHEKGLWFILDTAQTAGVLPIDFQALKLDALTFTGHKGLLGPQGVGGFLLSEDLAQRMDTLVSGGTGSLSEYEEVPPYLPDKFEAGTPNLPGIYGLNQSLNYIKKVGLATIREKELKLASYLLKGLDEMDGIRIVGPRDEKERMAVVSVDFEDCDNADIAYYLDKHHGIRTRCGLHCAPSAHKTLGTFPQGTVRFSPGHLNTIEEIETTLLAIGQGLRELRNTRVRTP
ncbi:MAG: aminotransferase class V-fold PLP-dependent enzyme [Firmicutes bacterium]|nr:aminotransferase class V-fold PLP-dependent enzyme [Bacillota bacterium]